LDLALIGNGAFQALIDRNARVAWLCWPRFDSSFVFGELLDKEKGGEFSVLTEADDFECTQRYLPGTAILETEFSRESEAFTVTDLAPRFVEGEALHTPRLLLRRLRPLRGKPRVQFRCRARYDYGTRALPAGSEELSLQMSEEIAEGEFFSLERDLYLVLGWQEELRGELAARCPELFTATESYWRAWCDSLRLPTEFSEQVERSAITLKLHQFKETGAITAAATTSIPEDEGSGRNWDYRFCWPRDAYFTVDVLQQLGSLDESRAFVAFLETLTGHPFQPLYGIAGEREVEEETLDHLAGYRGNRPVRIGNQAYVQDQHDIYGEMIAALAPLYASARKPGPASMTLLVKLLDAIEQNMTSPDAGLWEKRQGPVLHTFSLLMHWYGAKTAHSIATAEDDAPLAERALTLKERAREIIEERCWRPELGFYADSAEANYADASLFLMVTTGYLEPSSPRARSHVDGLVKRLQLAPHLFHRYRHDDGIGETHSCFTVCALWYAEALALMGDRATAEQVLRSVLGHANHVGLLSEDIDPKDGSLWGNFPQTYSHVGIIRCALALSKS
jgi:GH15 family glucan-1,4-alpha-glucosidase